MASMTIVYWRDIPAQVIVAAGRKKARRQLADHFQVAIDSAAMRAGCHGTDDYLNDWRRGQPVPCGDDLEAEVAAVAESIETDYDEIRLTGLINNKGRE
ncbi:MAG TPA: hypothetical protein ENI69_07515, partial [Rhodospirillales bacterium]|nr:hypothetical protein [Rhodospirillales bacterium]